MTLKNLNIDKSWTLFLDRDGVINKKLNNDYVKNWVEFQFLDHVLDSIKYFSKIFGKIIVVTNQQGIAKRLYSIQDLEMIHKNMMYEISYHGGKIDKVYFSPYLDSENHPTRKPKIGMALKAKEDFKEISFEKSLIVGDSMSDMIFGRNAGMKTIFISEKEVLNKEIDFNYASLNDIVISLQTAI